MRFMVVLRQKKKLQSIRQIVDLSSYVVTDQSYKVDILILGKTTLYCIALSKIIAGKMYIFLYIKEYIYFMHNQYIFFIYFAS